MQHIEDLKIREMLAASLLVVSIVGFGLLPTPLIDLSTSTLKHINISIKQRFL
jgi:NADH-quinone oxidoreductase subunit M